MLRCIQNLTVEIKNFYNYKNSITNFQTRRTQLKVEQGLKKKFHLYNIRHSKNFSTYHMIIEEFNNK